MTCPDLARLFGDKFKLAHDPVARSRREKADPWLMTMPGRFGTIYPHGPGRLAVEVDDHLGKARQLAQLPGVEHHQVGDHEQTLVFPVELFERVAQVIRPYRRRRVSSVSRANLVPGGLVAAPV
jgi:hypothetical protein